MQNEDVDESIGTWNCSFSLFYINNSFVWRNVAVEVAVVDRKVPIVYRTSLLWLEFGGEKQQYWTGGGGILTINVHFYMTEVIFWFYVSTVLSMQDCSSQLRPTRMINMHSFPLILCKNKCCMSFGP